ncbi:transient receptor potential cation channel subfamily A member 1 homolog [Strongylocentrotus purpuratus]|uniref:Uncharacterized protein n=1 Tax=Strongylocentrotus purpuratus TaxID=7668 RepID=A0A7M7PF48_STRPU|nr:transient receptor potential cation channel subfamily A member 1 homolog [Strongylocentrotus purpuratus]
MFLPDYDTSTFETKSCLYIFVFYILFRSLLELVAWDKDIINNAYSGGNSLLHLIAGNGHHQTTKAILKNPDVQMKKKNEKGQTALHVAIEKGYIMTSALILKTDKGLAEIKDNNKMTPLMYACRIGNIYIVKMLLEMLTEAKVKIGLLDCDGLNCLDHAIDNGKEMIAVELLDQDNWRSLMTRVATSAVGGPRPTPMRKLINSMPGVCKFVLDKCIKPEDEAADIELGNVKIKVDFELLEDWYSEWMREGNYTTITETL